MSYCVCCSYNESCGKSCSSCCFSTRDKILRTWKYTTKCICLKTKTIEKEGTSPENKTISENVCTIKLIQLVMLLGLIGLIGLGDYYLIGLVKQLFEPEIVGCSTQCCNTVDDTVCLSSTQSAGAQKVTYTGIYYAGENCKLNNNMYYSPNDNYGICKLDTQAPSGQNLTYMGDPCCFGREDMGSCTCSMAWALIGSICISLLIGISIIYGSYMTMKYETYQIPNLDVELV